MSRGRTLRCPNCDGQMREVERRGVVIDICNECRGVFLDRGELDALVEAVERVGEWYEQHPPRPPQGGHQQPYGHPRSPLAEAVELFQAVTRETKHRGHSGSGHGYKKHRKGGLADFFDF